MRAAGLAMLLLAALAGGAHAVTFKEVTIDRFEMCARYQPGQAPSGVVSIDTTDDSGEQRTVQKNVGDVLTAQEKTQMRTFLQGLVDRIYSVRAIPTPSPTPTASPSPTPSPRPTATPTPTPTPSPTPTSALVAMLKAGRAKPTPTRAP